MNYYSVVPLSIGVTEFRWVSTSVAMPRQAGDSEHMNNNYELVMHCISDDDVKRFDSDGAAVLRNVIAPDWIERMRNAVDAALANPTPAGGNYEASTGRFASDFFVWLQYPEIQAFIFESPLAEIAQRMMRSNKVNFFYDHLLVKEPGTRNPTPWHQDYPYWCVDGWDVISIWVPFDPVGPDNGVVQYVKGSHKLGKFWRPQTFGTYKTGMNTPQSVIDALPGMEDVPDIDGHPGDFELLTWTLEPGDVLVHHARTLHGAGGNRSVDKRRRALATRWTGDDVVYDPRQGTFEQSAKYSFATDGRLPSDAGAPMDSPLFPRVIPRPETDQVS